MLANPNSNLSGLLQIGTGASAPFRTEVEMKNENKEKAKLYKSKRQFWEINPVTRVVPNKKKYNRKREKRKWRDESTNRIPCYV